MIGTGPVMQRHCRSSTAAQRLFGYVILIAIIAVGTIALFRFWNRVQRPFGKEGSKSRSSRSGP